MAPSTIMPTSDGGRPLVGIETGSLSKLKVGGGPETRGPGGAEEGSAAIGLTAPTMVWPTRSRRDSFEASSLAGDSLISYGRWLTAGARTVVSTGASGRAYFWYEMSWSGVGSRSEGPSNSATMTVMLS